MKIYDFKKISKCFLGGNADINLEESLKFINNGLSNRKEEKIHPKEEERLQRIAKRKGGSSFVFDPSIYSLRSASILPKKQPKNFIYDNSVIIFSGGCGLGTKETTYFEEIFAEYNEVFAKNNCHILFIRGCNDDPSFFENETINYSNIKTIQDYSVIEFSEYNCLCIGGGVSVDRTWKINSEKNTGKKTYWENEDLIYKEKELDEILSKFDIACIITNEIPTFVPPSTGSYKFNKWFKTNDELIKDVVNSRIKVDNIYNKLILNNKKPYVWWHSINNNNSNGDLLVNDIYFSSVFNSIESLNNIVATKFNKYLAKDDENDFSKKFSKLKKKLDEMGTAGTYAEAPRIINPVEINPRNDGGRLYGGRVAEDVNPVAVERARNEINELLNADAQQRAAFNYADAVAPNFDY